MWIRNLLRQLSGLMLTALIGGLVAATLVRMAPGFDVDEREFDPRLSQASVDTMRSAREADRNLGKFYIHYLRDLATGNFGSSRSLQRPVSQLLAERGPVTLRFAGFGLAAGWILGLGVAIGAALSRRAAFDFLSASACSVFLCLPAALIGLMILFAGGPLWLAVALVVFPKVFSYSRNLLEQVYQAPHIVQAKANGLRAGQILLWHVIPVLAPELLALAGVSASLALSAAIPLEAVCDVAGLGQLAWQAALGRDLPVLVSLTLLLALVTRAANAAADVAISAIRGEAA